MGIKNCTRNSVQDTAVMYWKYNARTKNYERRILTRVHVEELTMMLLIHGVLLDAHGGWWWVE
jgi:hypothetical protein